MKFNNLDVELFSRSHNTQPSTSDTNVAPRAAHFGLQTQSTTSFKRVTSNSVPLQGFSELQLDKEPSVHLRARPGEQQGCSSDNTCTGHIFTLKC